MFDNPLDDIPADLRLLVDAVLRARGNVRDYLTQGIKGCESGMAAFREKLLDPAEAEALPEYVNLRKLREDLRSALDAVCRSGL